MSINGFVNAPNAGIVFVTLADFAERQDEALSAGAIAGALNQRFGVIQDAFVAVFPPPPILGLGSIGGFRMQIEDRAGLGFETLYAETQKLIGMGWQTPGLTNLFSGFQINVPQIKANVDREKAKAQGVDLDTFTRRCRSTSDRCTSTTSIVSGVPTR